MTAWIMMVMVIGVDSHQKNMKKRKEKLKYSFKTLEYYPAKDHCHYSGLPSPSAYVEDKKRDKKFNKKSSDLENN